MTERFLEIVAQHDIASRNAASFFLKEMLKYDIVRVVPDSAGRRQRTLEPAPVALSALFGWHALHLATLDRLDGGARAATFSAQPELLCTIQPVIADGLIGSKEVREPEATIVMERARQISVVGFGRFSTPVSFRAGREACDHRRCVRDSSGASCGNARLTVKSSFTPHQHYHQ